MNGQREKRPSTVALRLWAGLPERGRLRDCKSLRESSVVNAAVNASCTFILVDSKGSSHPEHVLGVTHELNTSPAVSRAMLKIL